jgi:hypothetical protein
LEIRVDKLRQVIAGCWAEAESSLAELIALKHPNPPEELITELLAGELRDSVAVASDSHKVEHAFLEDLDAQIPSLSVSDARRFGGLIASVAPHNKSHEGRVSAADLGILILRPSRRRLVNHLNAGEIWQVPDLLWQGAVCPLYNLLKAFEICGVGHEANFTTRTKPRDSEANHTFVGNHMNRNDS